VAWAWFDDIETDADVFPELGRDVERECGVALGRVGAAEARLFSQGAAVDFAVDWLRARSLRQVRTRHGRNLVPAVSVRAVFSGR
jgi:aminoglycoside 3-N-acetyltransferase